MASNAVQVVAGGLLAEMKGAFIEVINGSRQLTENELHALVRCFIKAKPHLSMEFKIHWCTDLITMIDFDEVRSDSGNAPETFRSLVEHMMKSE